MLFNLFTFGFQIFILIIMSAYTVCVTGSGLPLMSRKKGNSENLPFSSIGSLNGLHMFGKPLNIEILDTISDDYVVAWKEFNENIVVIGIASGCSLDVLNKLLETVFNCIVLIVGSEELRMQRNIERIKRELRICYPIVDRLLDSLDCGDASNKHSSDMIGYVETILSPENHLLQIVLESFTECVDSMFSCLLISGKVAVATENWWTLHPDEIRLLTLLAVCENNTTAKDVPVFLPYRSPTVAFRFVACTLMPDVQLCCLCGPKPVLNDIKHAVAQCFKNSTDILNSAVLCSPRNFPSTWTIDSSVLGILLVDINCKKYMMSKCPHQNSNRKTASSSHRLDIFRSFFYRTVNKYIIPSNDPMNDSDTPNQDSNLDQEKVTHSDGFNVATETYWCSEYHKCYGARFNDDVLCILVGSSVPTHAMRLTAQKVYQNVKSDKQVCW